MCRRRRWTRARRREALWEVVAVAAAWPSPTRFAISSELQIGAVLGTFAFNSTQGNP